MMLARTTEYAIRALVYIYIRNQEGKRPGFKEIAGSIDSPVQFTAKVLQTLTRAEIISSMKGRGGGFFFDQPSAPLTLYEVIKTMEGENFFSCCGLGLKHCSDEKPCPLHEEYAHVRDGFFNLVTNQTIQILADKINDQTAVLSKV
jgi:Rrf2 family protein